MADVPIIYEDDSILAINKPAGLLVHGATRGDGVTLADWILQKHPEVKNVGDEPALRPGIVHRLDKDTSGILIIAKNQKSFNFIKSQFRERKVKKTYLALVHGDVKAERGIIDSPIGASKKDFRKRASAGALKGKIREAVTEYKVLERFKNFTFLEVYPKTGRTHQIRVHLKSISHPVAGDILYGSKRTPSLPFLARQFLHASAIELTLPGGLNIRLEADLPGDLSNILINLRKE